MEGFRDVLKIVCIKSANGDSCIGSHVDTVLGLELIDHVLGEANVGEHTNLVSDVFPTVLGATGLQVLN